MDDRDEVEEDANTLTFGPGKPNAHRLGVFTPCARPLYAHVVEQWRSAPVAPSL